MRRLTATHECWPLRVPFTITGSTITAVDVVAVRIEEDGCIGRGEAAGVDYRAGESIPEMLAQIEALRGHLESGMNRAALQVSLRPGGARNAIDCALWELEAQSSGTAVWTLAGMESPRPLLTTFTIGADSAATMSDRAKAFADARAIKLKLTGESIDADRVRAVRDARPDVWLGIDANQGFTRRHFDALLPALMQCRVALIEQPFAVGKEPPLTQLQSPIPVAADESVQGLIDVASLAGRFDVINIKLDKSGGLTEALAMADDAQRHGMRVMVGNMIGTSLAMAPAFLLGQRCEIVDLDGPALLSRDRETAVTYSDGMIWSSSEVWGLLAR